ncbi:unnamed protein product [Clavelina lepadiformis]|uniref:Uncharacterized protein n=1 Tax=Clavelina lepadiformis TaxID=159417 RepID=A0ABP0FMS2_CLALP
MSLLDGRISVVTVICNHLQPSNIDDVIGLLRVVRDQLWMGHCFDGDHGRGRFANEDEINQLQSTLNEIQTGLEVHVGLGTRLRSQK